MKHICILLFILCVPIYATTTVPAKYYDTLKKHCTDYGVSMSVMARLLEWESGWNPSAVHVNSDGSRDIGIAQFNERGLSDLARWHNNGNAVNPWDWEVSIRVAVAHMAYLYSLTGSWWSAVASYNMGYKGYSDMIAGKRPMPIGTKKELDFVFR